MAQVIEVYRDILDDGAELIEDFATHCASEFGIAGDYSTVRFGDNPRIAMIRIFGDLATWAVNDEWINQLANTVKKGENVNRVDPTFMLYGWDLPKNGSVIEDGYESPRFELSEKRDVHAQYGSMVNNRFWGILHVLTKIAPREMVPKGLMRSVTSKTIPRLGIVGLDPSQPVPNRTAFKEQALTLNKEIPLIRLGPVCLEAGPAYEDAKANYGCLERPGDRNA